MKQNGACPKYRNCNYYQVTANYTDYGCALCESGFTLLADYNGSGECDEKNNIANCNSATSRPDMFEGQPFCWQCNEGYVLKNDSMSCFEVPRYRRIRNCNNYYTNDTKYYCNMCDDGYTLDNTKMNCVQGCYIDNCQNCQQIGSKSFCFNCKPGYIGVFNPKTFMFSECLTCDQFMQNKKARNESNSNNNNGSNSNTNSGSNSNTSSGSSSDNGSGGYTPSSSYSSSSYSSSSWGGSFSPFIG